MAFKVGAFVFDDKAVAEQFAEEHKLKVKPAHRLRLSDLLVFGKITGDIRERLAELTGDDSALDEPPLRDALADGSLESMFKSALDTAAAEAGLDVGGLGYAED